MNDWNPTGRLLLKAFRAFEYEVLKQLNSQGFDDITLSHLNLIRHLNPEGMRLTHLAHDAALSKQAVGKIAADLIKKDYIIMLPDPEDARAKRIMFSKKGKQLVKKAIVIVKKTEEAYEKLFGLRGLQLFRKKLNQIIEQEASE